MAKKKIEKEYKLKSTSNIQLKVSGQTDPSQMISGVKHFAQACGFAVRHIEQANAGQPNRHDTYFDTKQGTLQKNGISLRSRRRLPSEGEYEVTIKSSSDRALETGKLERQEIAIPAATGVSMIDALRSSSTAQFVLDQIPDLSELEEIAEIFNRRDKLRLEHKCGLKIDLCFDRYYFAKSNDFSEYNYEIEAEIQEQPEECLEPFAAFLEILKGIESAFEFVPNPSTKLEQAEEWFSSHSDRHHDVHFLGFDIVGYSRMDSKTQLSVVQRISKTTKEILLECGIAAAQVDVIIPTGDGVVVGFSGFQRNLLQTAITLHKAVLENESHFSKARVRTAIHYGPVFRFTDATERLSLAGKGINDMFRLLDLPDANQIFISEDARDVTVLNDPGAAGFFQGPHSTHVKHGQVLRYFNIYKEQDFGRPM